MRKSERSSSYQRSRHKSRSNKDRYRERDRSSRDKERNSRDKERDYDRDHYSSRHYKSKSKKSKHSKKSRHRRRSRSSSVSSTYSSSRDSRSSHSSRTSKYSSSNITKTRAPSSESNSRSAVAVSSANNTVSATNSIDLMDHKIQKALDTIEEDTFVPRAFFSTRDREAPEKNIQSDKVIIDLQAETVTFPLPLEKPKDGDKEELFHPNFLGDADQKQEKWVRKLFLYRMKE